MNMINNGGPAFPVWELNGKGQPEMTGFGMTMRDYFAAKAMQSILINTKEFAGYELVAAWSYLMADAMLKAREVGE